MSLAYSLRFCSICCRTIFAAFEFCRSDCTSTTSTVRVVGPQAADIGEDPAGNAQFLRKSERYRQTQRGDIVFVAAECVLRDGVAGADAGRLETAQIVTADEEAVLQQHLLTAIAEDISR